MRQSLASMLGAFSSKSPSHPCGRSYEGFVPAPLGSSAREFFASCLRMKSASVAAFRILEVELRELGASRSLLRACQKAATDEARHASELALPAGEQVAIPDVARRVRSTFSIALENARVGMVRETYGAVAARVQATRASGASARTIFLSIAADEMEHAELSFHVDAFLRAQLAPVELQDLDLAIAEEVSVLSEELRTDPPPSLISECGLPDAVLATGLVTRLRSRVWAPTFERLAA